MATAAVSLDSLTIEEYLETTYSPDREYIDGELLKRNVGKWEHAFVQSLIARLLGNRGAEWGILAIAELRVRVSSSHVRIPDVTIVPAAPHPDVLVDPPLAVIEVLSPRDTYSDTQRRAVDYVQMGIPAIWIIDPGTRTARQCVGDAWTSMAILHVPGSPVELSQEELFQELDKFQALADCEGFYTATGRSSLMLRTSRSGFSSANCSQE